MKKLVDMLVDTGLAKSKNEARTFIKQGAVRFMFDISSGYKNYNGPLAIVEGFPIIDVDFAINYEKYIEDIEERCDNPANVIELYLDFYDNPANAGLLYPDDNPFNHCNKYNSEAEYLDGLYIVVGKLHNKKIADLRFYHDKENMLIQDEIITAWDDGYTLFQEKHHDKS
jgi:hypothetical protein